MRIGELLLTALGPVPHAAACTANALTAPRSDLQRLMPLRAIGAVLAGCALALAFMPFDCGALAWVALVPLLLACRGVGTARAALLGALAGAVFSALGVHAWLSEVPGLLWTQSLALGIWFSLPLALWCAGLPWLARCRMPLLWSAPVWWTLLDLMRAHAGFLALPWATLAHSQHQNLALLQLAALGGEPAVTFVVALGGAVVAQVVSRGWERQALLALAAITAVHVCGGIVLWRGSLAASSQPVLHVAAIQPGIQPDERETAAGRAAIRARLRALTLQAAATGATLIVWPETAVGDLARDRDLAEELQVLADRTKATLVVGAAQTEKFSAAPGPGSGRGVALQSRVHNAAYLFVPGRPLGAPYRKRRLMPFAEYLPLEGQFDWPGWLAKPVRAATAGDAPSGFALVDGTRIGALICWENLFPDLARDEVRHGARLLVQLTNDVWFGRRAAAAQHNVASVLRAVENRVPMVIASNAGPSQVIDAYGRVRALDAAMFEPGFVDAVIAVPL